MPLIGIAAPSGNAILANDMNRVAEAVVSHEGSAHSAGWSEWSHWHASHLAPGSGYMFFICPKHEHSLLLTGDVQFTGISTKHFSALVLDHWCSTESCALAKPSVEILYITQRRGI